MRIIDVVVALALVLAVGFVAEWLQRKDVFAGPARVVDGDTLKLDGQRIRLQGMDAPELGQSCQRDGKAWPCGTTARFALAEMVQRGEVFCTASGQDAYGRALARCTVDGVDIAEELVRQGSPSPMAAMAMRRPKPQARAARRGMWAGTFNRRTIAPPIPARSEGPAARRAPGPPRWLAPGARS